MDMPWRKLTDRQKKLVWDGTDTFYGVKGLFEYLETKKYKMHVRVFVSHFKSPFTCPSCKGTRLKAEAAQVKIAGHSISEFCSMTLADLEQFMSKLTLAAHEAQGYRNLCAKSANACAF